MIGMSKIAIAALVLALTAGCSSLRYAQLPEGVGAISGR